MRRLSVPCRCSTPFQMNIFGLSLPEIKFRKIACPQSCFVISLSRLWSPEVRNHEHLLPFVLVWAFQPSFQIKHAVNQIRSRQRWSQLYMSPETDVYTITWQNKPRTRRRRENLRETTVVQQWVFLENSTLVNRFIKSKYKLLEGDRGSRRLRNEGSVGVRLLGFLIPTDVNIVGPACYTGENPSINHIPLFVFASSSSCSV